MTLKLVAALSKMVPMAHLCSASNPNYQVMVIFVVCQEPVPTNILLGMQLSLCVIVMQKLLVIYCQRIVLS